MKRFFLFFLAIWLSGCTALPSAERTARPDQPELGQFALNGRVSINHRGERRSAGLRWTHLARSDEILLLAPLGQTAARMYQDQGGATLESDGKYYQADDVERLMQQVLDWHLPLGGLHHWVLGLPATDSPAQVMRDEEGRLSRLEQDGWEVRYLRYADALPSRLQLTHEDLQVLLLIDDWDWDLH